MSALALGATAALSVGAATVIPSEVPAQGPTARVAGKAKRDRKPPKIRWATTINGAVAAARAKRPSCAVSAKDRSGIRRVQFYLQRRVAKRRGGRVRFVVRKKRIRKDTRAPYTCTVDVNKPGRYVLVASAQDTAGNAASVQTLVKVKGEQPPRPPATAPVPEPQPASAPSTPSGRAAIGISATIRGKTGSDLVNTVRRLREAGVEYTREDLAWRWVEETPGSYDWSGYDRIVLEAARQGLQIVAIPDSAPTWATGAWNQAPVSGEALRAYTEFVRRAIERYGSNGTLWAENPNVPKVPITKWDIWNEPYMTQFWNGVPDPVAYARMFKSVVSAVENVDPAAQFMLEAETGNNGYAWPQPPYLGAMLDAVPDLGRYVDIVSIHPYVRDSPTRCTPDPISEFGVDEFWKATRFQFCRVKDVRQILDAKGARNARIWITELGWNTAPQGDDGVSEATQAQYVRDTFRLLREWQVVDGIIWYDLVNSERDPTSSEDWYGLVHPDGSPKPAWNAFVDEIRTGLPAGR